MISICVINSGSPSYRVVSNIELLQEILSVRHPNLILKSRKATIVDNIIYGIYTMERNTSTYHCIKNISLFFKLYFIATESGKTKEKTNTTLSLASEFPAHCRLGRFNFTKYKLLPSGFWQSALSAIYLSTFKPLYNSSRSFNFTKNWVRILFSVFNVFVIQFIASI